MTDRRSAVILGRFQTPVLHAGHLHLIKTACEAHPGQRAIVLVAVHPFVPTRRNPLDFQTRRYVIEEAFRSLRLKQPFIFPITDCESDEEWSRQVDALVRGVNPAGGIIYGGRDNALSHYRGSACRAATVDGIDVPSATEIRAALIGDTPKEWACDYRWHAGGIITALESMPVRTFMAVDAVIVRKTHRDPNRDSNIFDAILLGYRPNGKHLQFPGGMVDPGESLEGAVRREVKEETGLDCESPRYLGSLNVDDWRVRWERESITSAVFVIEDSRGGLLRRDEQTELVDLGWFPVNNEIVVRDYIHPMHRPIFDMFLCDYRKRKVSE